MIQRLARAAAAGGCLILGGSPYNWWPLTIVGFALLSLVLEKASARQRFFLGWVTGAVLFLASIAWTRQFSVPGYVVLSLFQACFIGLGAVLVKADGVKRLWAFPAAFVAAELLRWYVPFGGFPMGGVTTGQASGPFLSTVAIFGELGLVAITAALGVALHQVVQARKPWRSHGAVVAVVVALAGLGLLVPVAPSGTIDVAAVQGGGPQALKRDEQQPAAVLARQFDTTVRITASPDLIVWPENVIAVDGAIEGTPIDARMASLSAATEATIVAGVVESNGSRFRNAALAWEDGKLVGRYEKVQRVPFGEYVPGREFIAKMADLSQVPTDAFVGEGPAVLPTEFGPLGVSISYEGLFSRRARAAALDGGQLLLIPTNAASYESPNVANAQVQAARLRAVETGRWVVQSSPTGISAIVNNDGVVQSQTTIGPSAVLLARVEKSTSTTPYVAWGDWPLGLLALMALTLGQIGGQVGRPLRPSRAGSKSSS